MTHSSEEKNACNLRMIIELTESVRRSRLRTEHHSAPVKRVVEYLNLNYSQNTSLAELSRIAGLAETYLSKVFKDEVGLNLSQYTAQLRCEQTAALLRGSEDNVQEMG